ncbi:hypothetical protein Trydic_g7117 [Trypoxylus dichotomus]
MIIDKESSRLRLIWPMFRKSRVWYKQENLLKSYSKACSSFEYWIAERKPSGRLLRTVWTTNDHESLMQKILTGDESWAYGYDIKTKVQS